MNVWHKRGDSGSSTGNVLDMSDTDLKRPEDHVEEIRKPTVAARLKAHLRRFWWLHLIIFICATLLIVLPLVYVGFPRIAQNGINKSTLRIDSLELSDPSPNSFHLKQKLIIGNHNIYHPRLDAFNVSLSTHGTGKPYAYVEMPAIHATEEVTSYVSQMVQIVDVEAFTAYNTLVVTKEEVEVDIIGRTDLHEMRNPVTTVDYRKTVTLKGLNGLSGFDVPDFEILVRPEADGTNMIGTVYIPNPSVMTIAMGNVTFNNLVQNEFIGTTTINNLVLVPGNNTVPIRSTIDQAAVIKRVVADFPDGFLPVDIVGNSSIYNGEHLPYFEEALAANTQHIRLNVGAKLKAIGFEIPGGS